MFNLTIIIIYIFHKYLLKTDYNLFSYYMFTFSLFIKKIFSYIFSIFFYYLEQHEKNHRFLFSCETTKLSKFISFNLFLILFELLAPLPMKIFLLLIFHDNRLISKKKKKIILYNLMNTKNKKLK